MAVLRQVTAGRGGRGYRQAAGVAQGQRAAAEWGTKKPHRSSTCVSERWGRNREEAELRHYSDAAAGNCQHQPAAFSSAGQERVTQSRKDAKGKELMDRPPAIL